MTLHRIRLQWLLLMAGLGSVAIAGLVVKGAAFALINESPSLPRGLYVRTGAPVARGAVVAIEQPEAARAYLKRMGMPKDVLLLKRVAAVEGDPVCAGEGVVRTPGRQVWTLDRDRQGAALPAWRACRRLAAGEVFLLGDTAGSFDSRYFGPVPKRATQGVYREVLTW